MSGLRWGDDDARDGARCTAAHRTPTPTTPSRSRCSARSIAHRPARSRPLRSLALPGVGDRESRERHRARARTAHHAAATARRHVPRWSDVARSSPTSDPTSSASLVADRHHARRQRRQGPAHHRLRERSDVLRRLRRAARANDRSTTRRASVRHFVAASCTTPSSASDGSWVWRHQQHAHVRVGGARRRRPLGEARPNSTMPVTLLRAHGTGLGRRRRRRSRVPATAARTRRSCTSRTPVIRSRATSHSCWPRCSSTLRCLSMAGGGGLEPPTYGFKVRRSAN